MNKKHIAIIFSLAVLLVFTGLSYAEAKPMINSIRFESPTANEDRVIFELNGPFLPTGKALPGDNPRIYFDFFDTAPANTVKNRIPANGNFVKQIRSAYHKGEKSKTRVVFDLEANQKMDFRQDFNKDTNTLVITVYIAGNEPEPIAVQTPPEQEPVAAEEPILSETSTADVGKKIQPIQDINMTAPEEPIEIVPEPEQETAAMPEPEQEAAAMPEPEQEAAVMPEPEQDAAAMPEPEQETATMPEPEQETAAMLEPEQEAAAMPEPEQETAPQEELPQVSSIQPSTKTQDILETPADEATVIQPLSEIGIQQTEGTENEPSVLHSIEFDPKSNRGEMISFKLNGFHPPVVFGIEEDIPRIVCFFKNTKAGSELGKMIGTNGRYVKNIKIGKYENPDNIRVVLELVPGNNYDLQQIFFKDDKIFMMIINKAGKQISTQSK